MYQSNKIKQAQIFFFLTIAMMAFWMFVATGYLFNKIVKEYSGNCHCREVKYKFFSENGLMLELLNM